MQILLEINLISFLNESEKDLFSKPQSIYFFCIEMFVIQKLSFVMNPSKNNHSRNYSPDLVRLDQVFLALVVVRR